MHRSIPQPSEIEKLMKEKLEHRMINDEFGWTGEWRMCAKDVFLTHKQNEFFTSIRKPKIRQQNPT